MISLPYKILAVVALCAGLWWHGWFSGKGACQNAQLKETVKTIEKVRYVRQKVDSLPDASIDSELHKWQRD